MTVPSEAFPRDDGEVAGFARELGIPGIVDVHVHFLPEPLQRAVWRYFDRLDDPPWPVTYRDDELARLATLRDLGVVSHTALAYPHRAGVADWLNDHTLELAARHEQVIPTFTFHPDDDAGDQVRRAIARGGVVAKVHLQVGRFATTDPRLDGAWELLARHRVPVVLHAGAVYGVDGGEEFCGVGPVVDLLDRHPDLVLIVAHLGGPDFEAFLRLAEQTPGLLLDTAMVLTDPPYLGGMDPGLLPRYRALADRLVFGSDFPTIPHRYAAQVRGLAQLRLDERQLRGVLHDTARSVLREVSPDGVGEGDRFASEGGGAAPS